MKDQYKQVKKIIKALSNDELLKVLKEMVVIGDADKPSKVKFSEKLEVLFNLSRFETVSWYSWYIVIKDLLSKEVLKRFINGNIK